MFSIEVLFSSSGSVQPPRLPRDRLRPERLLQPAGLAPLHLCAPHRGGRREGLLLRLPAGRGALPHILPVGHHMLPGEVMLPSLVSHFI